VQEAIYSERSSLRSDLSDGLRRRRTSHLRRICWTPGASAKQTTPVFASYAPPAAKKKEAQKARLDTGERDGRDSGGGQGCEAGSCGSTATRGGLCCAKGPRRWPQAKKPKKIPAFV